LQSLLADAVAVELLVAALPDTLLALFVVGPELDAGAPAPLSPEAPGTNPAEELAVPSDASGSMGVDSFELVFDVGSESDTDPCLTVQFVRTTAPQRKAISAMCAPFMLRSFLSAGSSLRSGCRVSGRTRPPL
jgi:hypothetical protein